VRSKEISLKEDLWPQQGVKNFENLREKIKMKILSWKMKQNP
jgi:hypothetical protein